MDIVVKWFTRLWLSAAIISILLWLWKHFPFGLALLAVLVFLAVRSVLNERQRRQKMGYWLEYLSPGRLRDGENDFAIVYHEEDNQHFFSGKVGKRPYPDILRVPNVNEWQAQVPAWMSGNREVVLERIQQQFKKVQIREAE